MSFVQLGSVLAWRLQVKTLSRKFTVNNNGYFCETVSKRQFFMKQDAESNLGTSPKLTIFLNLNC